MDTLANPDLWAAVVAALMALAGLAVVVTQMTTSVKDDEYASKFLKFAQWLGERLGAKPQEPK